MWCCQTPASLGSVVHGDVCSVLHTNFRLLQSLAADKPNEHVNDLSTAQERALAARTFLPCWLTIPIEGWGIAALSILVFADICMQYTTAIFFC